MIFKRSRRLIGGIVSGAFLLTGANDLPAQHAADTGSGLAMAPPHYYEHGFDEPFNHIGVQVQGGLTRLNDYEYSLGPSYPTVVADHLPPLSLTATATYFTEPHDVRIGIGVGYQRTSLRSVVEYPGVPLWRPENDSLVGTVEFIAENRAESIVLDLIVDLIRLDLGPGQVYLRTGLRNRATLHQEREEEIRVREEDAGMLLAIGDGYTFNANGVGAEITFSSDDDFGLDVAADVGIGWRIGFSGSTKYDTDSTEFDEFDFGHDETYGPILFIPTIDFYLPVLGSHPIEQASWEVMVGAGFVVPL